MIHGAARAPVLGVGLATLRDMSRRPLGGHAKAAIALQVFLGIGAIGGGLALVAGPHGEILPLPVSALAGSPFASYLVPGLILLVILGLGPIGVAALAWMQHRAAPLLTLAVGNALIVWIVVEIAIIGYSNHPPLQAVYLALGVAIVLVSAGWLHVTGAFPRDRPAIEQQG